jgi:uncharacterized membrane protein YcaP (DUF421 family)
MELYKIAIRVLFAYIFLQMMMRRSGKGEVSQARAIDFVMVIIMGDMIDDLLWGEVPAGRFVVGVTTIMLVHAALLVASHRWPPVASLLDGRPALLIRDGTLLRAPMRRERITIEDIEAFLRLRGLERDDWPQVKSLMIDRSGRPALILHEWARPVQEGERKRFEEAGR